MPQPARRVADLVSVVRLAQLSPQGPPEPIRLSLGKERIAQSPKPPRLRPYTPALHNPVIA